MLKRKRTNSLAGFQICSNRHRRITSTKPTTTQTTTKTTKTTTNLHGKRPKDFSNENCLHLHNKHKLQLMMSMFLVAQKLYKLLNKMEQNIAAFNLLFSLLSAAHTIFFFFFCLSDIFFPKKYFSLQNSIFISSVEINRP